MKQLLDLHTHTTASDGIYTPSGLIDYAIESGLSVVAITDHDTTEGLEEAIAHAARRGITLIPGIEFSVEFPKGSFHLIGLYVHHADRELLRLIVSLKERRSTRIYRMIDDLKIHGIDIPYDEVVALSGGGSIGRPHVARIMVKYGYAPSVKEVFAHYLVSGKPGYVKKDRVSFDDAIKSIVTAGGIPIIAHPSSLECADMNQFETLLHELTSKGLRGIEVYSAMHTNYEVSEFLRLAKKYNLLITGGSDFHGDKSERIGYYSNDDPIPYEIFEQFKER